MLFCSGSRTSRSALAGSPAYDMDKFVDLVEDEDRVPGACLLDALDDPPGQGPDIRPPVPRISASSRTPPRLTLMYFRPSASAMLLPRLVLPVPGGLAKRRIEPCFSCLSFMTARCWTIRSLTFSRPLWWLSRTPGGPFDIDVLLLFGLPGEVEQEVKVVPDDGALMVLAATGLKFLYFDKGLFPHIVRHLRFPQPAPGSLRHRACLRSRCSSSWITLSCSRKHRFTVRFAHPVGDFFCHLDPDTDVLPDPDEGSRNVMYRCRTEAISRSACFSARLTGRKGMTNPMIWSTESIWSMGRVNCSEPENRLLISWMVSF